MSPLMRGAIVEYESDFLGPLPNVILFQFNPETLTRTIDVPQRPTGTTSRETTQAGETPVEKISFTAHFDAADYLANGDGLARAFGIGPFLAALEKMVYPGGMISGILGRVLDAIGSAVGSLFSSGGGSGAAAAQPIPREKYPRLLFLWGPLRILPVIIQSMEITEQEYDYLLNPVRAEVQITLAVIAPDRCSDDIIAIGASKYSGLAKETQAIANLANTVRQVEELIRF